VDILEIDGTVSPDHADRLENAIWQHLPDLAPLRADQFGDYSDRSETRHSDPLAITQLLLTYHLLRQYSGVANLPFARPVAALSRMGQTADSAAGR
jgi:phosphoribulokinase